MIGMNTGGVEMTETQGLLIKAIQIGESVSYPIQKSPLDWRT